MKIPGKSLHSYLSNHHIFRRFKQRFVIWLLWLRRFAVPADFYHPDTHHSLSVILFFLFILLLHIEQFSSSRDHYFCYPFWFDIHRTGIVLFLHTKNLPADTYFGVSRMEFILRIVSLISLSHTNPLFGNKGKEFTIFCFLHFLHLNGSSCIFTYKMYVTSLRDVQCSWSSIKQNSSNLDFKTCFVPPRKFTALLL